jgi:phosphoribosylanthranilate isomerase
VAIWVKICGLTTGEAVEAAVAAGADAVGFVFAPSRRQVTAARAVELSRSVPRTIPRVAVMLHPTQSQLDEVWSVFRPDVLQTDVDDLETLRVPAGIAVMPVIRSAVGPQQNLRHSHKRVLFEGPVSGIGSRSDWNSATQLALTTQLVLAGGLNSTNVADANATVRPYGVDVSSGVEATPGIKDPAKIHEFVRRARAASERSS